MNYTKLEFDTIYMGQDKQMTSMGSLAFVGTLENVIFNTKYLIDKWVLLLQPLIVHTFERDSTCDAIYITAQMNSKLLRLILVENKKLRISQFETSVETN